MNQKVEPAEPSLRLPGVERGDAFQVEVDGEWVEAYAGESVAAILIACGKRVFHHAEDGSKSGYFCGIGRCFSCLVTIDGLSGQRACVTPVRPGMTILTGERKAGPT
jgi:sarcosine oxidase subunit alpha